MEDLGGVLGVAIEAARVGVEVQRTHLGTVLETEWEEKGVHDFVTRVDREAESRIVARVRAAYPDHAILAEEESTGAGPVAASNRAGRHARGGEGGAAGAGASGGGDPSGARRPGWLWIIDPLDGTTNYLHGYPMYAVSIAALKDGELAVGVVMHGVSGETWTAVRGQGAFLDGRPIRVSATTRMSSALIGTGFPFRALDVLPSYVRQFERVIHATAGLRRGGSAALDLCHVATGYFDAFWEHRLAPWDVAAGTLIIREAGGVVTRIDGDPDVLDAGSLLAGNPHVHAALMSILNESGT